MIVLAIDIGTNSVRYLVCDISGQNNFEVIERGGEITRLGEGTDESGILNKMAIKRTADAIKNIILRGEELKAKKNILIATSAARDARNSEEFLAIIKNITGFVPKILTGEEEAEAIYKGVTHGLHGVSIGSIIADIGGGSTELIYTKGRDDIIFNSINIGAVRMTERFITNDPPLKTELDNIRAYIIKEFNKYINQKEIKGLKFIGLGGTITTLVAIHLRMRKYEQERVHGFQMSHSDVQQILKKLSVMTLDDRKKVIGLQPERADIIVAGAVILDTLLEFAGNDSFQVSDRGILFGLALLAAGK